MPVTSKAQLRFMQAIAYGKRKETGGVTKEKAKEFLTEIPDNLPERKKPTNILPTPTRKR